MIRSMKVPLRSIRRLAVLVFPAALLFAACPSKVPEAPTQASSAEAQSDGPSSVCGPQSPRNISKTAGTNTEPVPSGPTPNLCNVHFHRPFEHAGFSAVPKVEARDDEPVCRSIGIGNKVEFHWVYTNCELPVPAKKGLANCVCDPQDPDEMVLRVFGQAYVVAESGEGPSQPTSDLLSYAGSTTGKDFDNETCSPARVNWEVSRTVREVGKEALGAWCADNPWIGEDRPHKSRVLVTRLDWLSAIE